jgi:hypothetical protein
VGAVEDASRQNLIAWRSASRIRLACSLGGKFAKCLHTISVNFRENSVAEIFFLFDIRNLVLPARV